MLEKKIRSVRECAGREQTAAGLFAIVYIERQVLICPDRHYLKT